MTSSRTAFTALITASLLFVACNEQELNPLSPDIFASPEEMDFGTVTVGILDEQLLAVHNVGGGTLTVDSVVMLDGTAGFSVEDFAGEIVPDNLVELLVEFQTAELGPAEDVILITSNDPDEPELEVPVYVLDVVEAPYPAIAWSPSSLDWGATYSGAAISKTVTVTSVGTGDLDVSSIYLAAGTSPDFTIQSNPAPATLPPSMSTMIEVQYAPSDNGADAGTLVIECNDPSTPQVLIPLNGDLLPAADIDLVPTTLAFGQLAIGSTTTMDAEIWSLGQADLELGTLTYSGSSEFTMMTDPSGTVLQPGQYTTVTVQYAPSNEQADTGEIEIPSNDPDEPVVYLQITAPEPAPDIDCDPWTVDFGDIKLYDQVTEWVTCSNLGTSDLTIYSDSISGDPEFTIATSIAGSVLAPGDSVQLEVAYEPHYETASFGQADIDSNDPVDPTVSVDLLGLGVASAIEIDPAYWDFGTLNAGCDDTIDVEVRSVGNAPLELWGFTYTTTPNATMEADTDDLSDYVNNGWELAPGDSVTVPVTFIPDDVISYTGQLTVTSDDPYNTYAYGDQEGDGAAGGWYQDSYLQEGNNWTDILWVVDNSCSMGDEQGQLGDDFSYFYSIINTAGIDYHIATVTTDNASFQGSQKVIYPTTPNGSSVFASNCSVGTTGSATERGLMFGWDALTMAMNQTSPNQNFWRDDAGLRVVYVSDESDQSGSWSTYLSYYQGSKVYPDYVILSAICGTDGVNATSCSGAGGSAYAGTGYVDVANSTGGVLGSICESDWSTTLTNLGWISMNLADTFTLTYQAIPNTIEVSVNGVLVTIGWSYDASINAVVFLPSYVPSDGDVVQIYYGYYGSC